ncbi:hypothetical protein TcasGA2_TC010730 [Tribolium castaneum]|uniref:Uncharacterized protein n=1 Tax=Tribolium castaneum TaxID=7070 RepID=D7GXW3_TRICA|nr:hypothetical protein TcasGA2_TC010730 [Tribolium castaneum]
MVLGVDDMHPGVAARGCPRIMVGHVSDYTLFSSHTIYCDRHKSLNWGDSSASLYEVRRARPLTHSQTFQIETPIIYKFLTRPDGFSIRRQSRTPVQFAHSKLSRADVANRSQDRTQNYATEMSFTLGEHVATAKNRQQYELSY